MQSVLQSVDHWMSLPISLIGSINIRGVTNNRFDQKIGFDLNDASPSVHGPLNRFKRSMNRPMARLQSYESVCC